jgi:hypothetical protein
MTTENKPTNYKYHSTQQFRNVVRTIKEETTFSHVDSDGKVVYDNTKRVPTLDYVGTTKLHGTNASIILHEDKTISFHSKSNLLGFYRDGEFTLMSDNAEFAQSMQRRMNGVLLVVEKACEIVGQTFGYLTYPIKIAGEWAGSGIQNWVGISCLPHKSLFIFGLKVGECTINNNYGWLPVQELLPLQSNEHHIYSIVQFPVKEITIDFSKPEFSQNDLVLATEMVEEYCPVSEQLNTTNAKGEPTRLGEGLVWTPKDRNFCRDSGKWFKTKGQKHSVSKVKSVASVSPEKLSSIKDFVEYTLTENRLEQGVQEVGLDFKTVGSFIGWINKDINKEEGDVLEANNLTMQEVGKYIADGARQFYLNKLQDLK